MVSKVIKFEYKTEEHIEELKQYGRKVYRNNDGKYVGAECTVCGGVFTWSSFNFRNAKKNLIHGLCKACQSVKAKDYYYANRERISSYMRDLKRNHIVKDRKSILQRRRADLKRYNAQAPNVVYEFTFNHRGKTYKYIGSTTRRLNSRVNNHCSKAKNSCHFIEEFNEFYRDINNVESFKKALNIRVLFSSHEISEKEIRKVEYNFIMEQYLEDRNILLNQITTGPRFYNWIIAEGHACGVDVLSNLVQQIKGAKVGAFK